MNNLELETSHFLWSWAQSHVYLHRTCRVLRQQVPTQLAKGGTSCLSVTLVIFKCASYWKYIIADKCSVHVFKPTLGRQNLSLKPAWWIPGQSELYGEALSQKQPPPQKKRKERKKEGRKERKKKRREKKMDHSNLVQTYLALFVLSAFYLNLK